MKEGSKVVPEAGRRQWSPPRTTDAAPPGVPDGLRSLLTCADAVAPDLPTSRRYAGDVPDEPDETAPHQSTVISRGPRRVAALLTGLQALGLLGFAVFFLYELAVGEGSDPVRVVMSALLIAVFGVGLGLAARAWLGDAVWPRTPTIVWSALLFPVGGGMIQGGLRFLGWGLLAMALGTALVALAAKDVDPLAPEVDGDA